VTDDLLAGLQCLAGGSACGCLPNLISNRRADHGEAYGQEFAACEGSSPTFGPALRAARRFCSF
jgi:hypothetical protein